MYSSMIRAGGKVFLSLFLVCAALAQADNHQEVEPQAPQPFDVRIIIDISGSMKETDPDNLRIPALNLLSELLPEGSQAGIWTFGRYVNNILPVAEVSAQWRSAAKASAAKINSVGLMTNLPGALDDAAWGVKADSGYQHSVILLTDGMVDMASSGDSERQAINKRETERLLAAVLDKYRTAGANVHTLALSDKADLDLLQQIALETDGLYSLASDADQLMKAFLRAFDRAVPAEQVPMEDNTFSIDGSVKEFTALVFRAAGSNKETRLLTPGGESYGHQQHPENVRWYKDVMFDLITVKAPEEGTWIAEADLDPANRVTILSDLALVVEGLPATIFPGDKLDLNIQLSNEGEVVSKPEILRLTDFIMTVVTGSGKKGSKVLSDPENPPEDGIYREALHRLKDLGEYQVDVVAEGRTFQRKRSFSMTMIQPIEVQHGQIEGKDSYQVSVIPLSDNLDTEKSRVIAKIKSPDDNTIIQSMAYDSESNRWAIEISADKGPGTYQIDLNVRGMTASGKKFKVKPESILVELPMTVEGAGLEPDQSVQLGDGQLAEPENGNEMEAAENEAPGEPAMPDLAAKFEQQQSEAEPKSKPAPEPKPDAAAPVPEQPVDSANDDAAVEEEAESGLAWWIYALLAVANLAIIGGAVWWFVFRKKEPELAPAETSMEMSSSAGMGDLDELDDFEDELAGDFDSLDEGVEEDIPTSAPAEDAGAAGMDKSDDDFSAGFDEDFALDAEDEGDDSWGEFDTEDSSQEDPPKQD